MVKQTTGIRPVNRRSPNFQAERQSSTFHFRRAHQRGMARIPDLGKLFGGGHGSSGNGSKSPIKYATSPEGALSLAITAWGVTKFTSEFSRLQPLEEQEAGFKGVPSTKGPSPTRTPIGHLPDGTLIYPEEVTKTSPVTGHPTREVPAEPKGYSLVKRVDYAGAQTLNSYADASYLFLTGAIIVGLANFAKNTISRVKSGGTLINFDFPALVWTGITWAGVIGFVSSLKSSANAFPDAINNEMWLVPKFAGNFIYAIGNGLASGLGFLAATGGLVAVVGGLLWIGGKIKEAIQSIASNNP